MAAEQTRKKGSNNELDGLKDRIDEDSTLAVFFCISNE